MGKATVIDRRTKQSILDIAERLLSQGEINLGCDDIKSVLLQGEETVVAFGRGSGQNRTLKACDDALVVSGYCDNRLKDEIRIVILIPQENER